MKRFTYIGILSLLLCSCVLRAWAGELPVFMGRRVMQADSIMSKVIFFAPFYEHIIDEYRAELYIKGRIHIRKKNHIIRFLPTMFRLQKGVNKYMVETYSDLHFTAPDIYDQKVKASVGTTSGFWEADGRLPEYFYVNIYSPTLIYDKLLSPLAPNAMKFYTFRIDSVMGTPSDRTYKISFQPKNKSYQLVTGHMVVSDNVWSIREISFSGRSEMFRFNNRMLMGEVGAPDEFLPVRSDLEGTFRFLGNVIEGTYVAMLDYKEIRPHNPEKEFQKRHRSRYDLTDSYVLRTDTNAYLRDTAYFNKLRPLPLTSSEQQFYSAYAHQLLKDSTQRKRTFVSWAQVEDMLITNHTLNLKHLGNVRFSPLINPLMIGYSTRGGISYKQSLYYNAIFAGDRLLRVVPSVGYAFKRKEFYWRVESDYVYWPRKRVSLHLDVGNNYRGYPSALIRDLGSIPDSIFNRMHLDYYKDLYVSFRHSWEIVNGLTLDLNLNIHHRTDDKPGGLSSVLPVESTGNLGGDNAYSRYHIFNSFAPGIRLTWRPGQYYYMDGDRKVNLHSRYPTVSFDWERGIDGVLPNSGSHERFEVDVQHTFPFGLMRDLYVRLGWGAFTDQEGIYFVDYANLLRTDLPLGWNDDLGGVFQLLDRRWYNSSRHYVRGNLTYEAPFLLMPHLSKYTQYVLNERLYFGALFVPRLMPYVELGYGIGTHIFDFGVFCSFANWKFEEVGVKFTFELFNR